MAKLHDLPKLVHKRKKRLARGYGSGKGAKSGRGTTRHQTARTNVPLHFEGGQNKITKKFPLLRGKGRNKSVKVRPETVNVTKLNSLKKGTEVTIESLIKEKLVTPEAQKKGVKILGRGSLDVALKVALPASKKARKKIEDAGGTLVEAHD